MDRGISTYGYVSGKPINLIDPFGLLSPGATKCICDFMRACNFVSDCAWLASIAKRKRGRWGDPIMRSCENYLYGYAAVESYGDAPGRAFLGVQLHHFIKYVPFV